MNIKIFFLSIVPISPFISSFTKIFVCEEQKIIDELVGGFDELGQLFCPMGNVTLDFRGTSDINLRSDYKRMITNTLGGSLTGYKFKSQCIWTISL